MKKLAFAFSAVIAFGGICPVWADSETKREVDRTVETDNPPPSTSHHEESRTHVESNGLGTSEHSESRHESRTAVGGESSRREHVEEKTETDD
ncbi:MAG TPA: hypothetical protein VFD92_14820 [Candidatus Binatia bacterium]|nr:hypothetical protein [Candidatus Binatia bacterium]